MKITCWFRDFFYRPCPSTFDGEPRYIGSVYMCKRGSGHKEDHEGMNIWGFGATWPRDQHA